MVELVSQILRNFDYALLLFIRVSGLIMPSPIFGRRNLPSIIKISFCILLTCLFFVSFPLPEGGVSARAPIEYFFMCFKELLFGLTMGFLLTMFFNIAIMAGQLMDMQIGFGMASVFDIQFNSQIPVAGNIMNLILLVLFFSMNGHLKLIEMIHTTIVQIPIGQVYLSPELALAIIGSFCQSFVLAIMLAMPLLASGIVLEMAMGVLLRAVPQMNMFVVGIPMKLLIGLIMLLIMIPAFTGFSEKIFNELFLAIGQTFSTFGAAA